MTNEGAANVMKKYTEDYCGNTISKIVSDAHKMAISALERDRWIPVTERLPEPEKEVSLTVERRDAYGKCRRFTVRAIYEDGSVDRYNSNYEWDDELDFDYDSETDTFFVPKGWFEAVTYIEHFQAIPDFDIAWRPLPEPYNPQELKYADADTAQGGLQPAT